MQTLLNVAVSAAQTAGEFIQAHSRNISSLNVEQKSLNDFVSEVDRGAENLIRKCIQASFPEHSVLGEEYGYDRNPQQENSELEHQYQWIIDPLDGTTNFLRGIPHYAISIAVLMDDELVVGVVFDPVKDEMFTAIKGQGAYLNERLIHTTTLMGVSGALLATGIPFSGELLQKVALFSDAMTELLNRKTSGVRRLGAAALDLAYVAAGRYDGFWEAGLKPWDIAAGILLVQEAGGRATDFDGAKDYFDSGHIVACASGVHDEMRSIVNSAYKTW